MAGEAIVEHEISVALEMIVFAERQNGVALADPLGGDLMRCGAEVVDRDTGRYAGGQMK